MMSDIIGGITLFVEVNTVSTTRLLRVMGLMVTIMTVIPK